MGHPQDYYGPHDYYGPDGFPEHRVMGHPRDYLETDILGPEAGDSLPIVSTIGAGPPGRGLIARSWSDSHTGSWGFEILDDQDGQVYFRSPNLIPGHIILTQDHHEMVAGEPSIVHVHYEKDGCERVEDLVLNPGSDGTRIFFREEILKDYSFDRSHAFTINFEDLQKHELHNFQHHLHPDPRVDDVILGFAQNSEHFYLTIGIIEFVNNEHDPNYPYDIVYVIHTAYEWGVPSVGENGNWWFNGDDTGIPAQGPPGEPGEAGHSPKIEVKSGKWYIDGRDTGWSAQGEPGPPGHTPDVGLNGNWFVNGKDTGTKAQGDKGDTGEPGPPGRTPEFTVDPDTGHWLVDGEDTGFNARGEDGFAFDLQYNYYILGQDELPDYDSVPYGFAFVVRDKDPEYPHDRYDLYYKGRVPVASEDGGPWVVIEDWQGMPGYSFHLYDGTLDDLNGKTTEELHDLLKPGESFDEGDTVLTPSGELGLLQRGDEDDTWQIVPAGQLKLPTSYEDLSDRPTIEGTPIEGEMVKEDWQIPTFHLLHDPMKFNPEIGEQTTILDVNAQTSFDPYDNLTPGGIFLDDDGYLARYLGPIGAEGAHVFETVGSVAVDIDRITEQEIDDLLKEHYHPGDLDIGSITEEEIDELLDLKFTQFVPIPDPDIADLFEGISEPGPNTGGNSQSWDIDSIPKEDIDELFGAE